LPAAGRSAVAPRLRFEKRRDRRAPAGDARSNCSDRNRKDICDLRVIEVEQVAEHDRRSLVLWNLLQRCIDVEPGADRVCWIDPRLAGQKPCREAIC
jgi:hypothetical protein